MTHSLKTIGFLAIVLSFFTSYAQKDKNTTIYQYATINALMEGGFDGDMTLAALQKKGTFGIGTFNELDGEMIGFDNHFYQIKSDGKAYVVAAFTKNSFCCSCQFLERQCCFCSPNI